MGRAEVDSYGPGPVDLAAAKLYLKVSNSADDTVIQQIIDAATAHARRMTGYSLSIDNVSWYADYFETPFIIGVNSPQDITSVEYVFDGQLLTFSADSYSLYRNAIDGELVLNEGYDWPDTDLIADAIRVQLVTSVDLKVDEVKVQILKHIAHAYENRGDDGYDPAYGFGAIDFYRSVTIPKF